MKRLSPADLAALARERGLNLTPQRRAIVEYLHMAANHPTADDVFEAVNGRFPMTSRATVYNTLRLLSDAGLLQEMSEDGVSRFDPVLEPHHHFVCRVCGKMEDVSARTFDALSGVKLAGRRVESYEVTARGVCGACSKRH